MKHLRRFLEQIGAGERHHERDEPSKYFLEEEGNYYLESEGGFQEQRMSVCLVKCKLREIKHWDMCYLVGNSDVLKWFLKGARGEGEIKVGS